MRKKMKNKTNLWVTLGLLVVAIIWGTGFIATQIAIDEGLSASFITFVRFAVASLVLGASFGKDIKVMTKIDIKMGLIAGGFLFLGFTLQTTGLNFTTPSSNAFITATSVVMVPFLSWLMLKEKPQNKVFVAALICLLGISMLAFGPGEGIKLGVGDAFTLACAVAFALHTVTMGKYAPKMNSNLLTFLQLSTAGILSFIMFLMVDRDFTAFASIKGLMAVIYLGIFSTFIAYTIQTICQRYASPSKVSIIVSTEALFGSLFSVVLGYEAFTYFLLIGGIAIISAMLIIETNFIKKEAR